LALGGAPHFIQSDSIVTRHRDTRFSRLWEEPMIGATCQLVVDQVGEISAIEKQSEVRSGRAPAKPCGSGGYRRLPNVSKPATG
jgi:hypothetical protein